MLSSEAVAGGHPDKIADQISDSILDAYLRNDPSARVACEVLWSGNLLVIGGEITSTARINHEELARGVLSRYAYHVQDVIDCVSEQSPEISGGVFGREQGAGDQGIMFGYANDHNELGLWKPHAVALKLVQPFTQGKMGAWGFKYDAKSQVTVDHNGVIDQVVLSASHVPNSDLGKIRDDLEQHVRASLVNDELSPDVTLHLNPAGLWSLDGGHADAGLTGRKIIVDTYGGRVPHGGGAFSGKDPSKVDRSAAYMARALAKAVVVGAGISEVVVQLGYAIGVAEPVSVAVCDINGAENVALSEHVRKTVDLRPAAIIERLGLRNFTSYEATATGGHFGSDCFPWERVSSLAGELF